jgi:hypothetical protein
MADRSKTFSDRMAFFILLVVQVPKMLPENRQHLRRLSNLAGSGQDYITAQQGWPLLLVPRHVPDGVVG